MSPYLKISAVIAIALAPPCFARAPRTREEAVKQAMDRFDRQNAWRGLLERQKQERKALQARQKTEREGFKLERGPITLPKDAIAKPNCVLAYGIGEKYYWECPK